MVSIASSFDALAVRLSWQRRALNAATAGALAKSEAFWAEDNHAEILVLSNCLISNSHGCFWKHPGGWSRLLKGIAGSWQTGIAASVAI